MEGSKNFLEFSVFAAGRLRIWLIFWGIFVKFSCFLVEVG